MIEISAPSFYQQPGAEVTRVANQLNNVHDELTQAYRRPEEFEKPGLWSCAVEIIYKKSLPK
jgi:hypothetical protein